MNQIWETDWLASRPIFYNEKNGKISYNINDVIDFPNLEFDPEGLNNYLDFGFSVFEQTLVKNVKFLRHSSQLIKYDDGTISVEYFKDSVEQNLGANTNEDEVLGFIESKVKEWEKSVKGEIIIPTSGGYDSRLLNFFVEDKSRIRSFTYGISPNQEDSYEVVYARKLSEILDTNWEMIRLGRFHDFFKEWDALYGPSVHAHGMYHFEFYSKILNKVNGGNPFLSGIIGDAWSGRVGIGELNGPQDLVKLGYTHGMHANSCFSNFETERPRRYSYYEDIKDKIKDENFKIIEAMRLKIILLSYLIELPHYFNFKPFSPFLDLNLVTKMLSLRTDRKQNRQWQKDFFQKYGLDLENMGLKANFKNNLNHQGMKIRPLSPLNVNILREVVKASYVEWINAQISLSSRLIDFKNNCLTIRKIGGLMRKIGIKNSTLQAYSAYLTLKPIEYLIKKRNMNNG